MAGSGPFGGMAEAMSAASQSASQAVTPGGTAGPRQDGTSPNAKRPLTKMAVDVANTGSRLMSQEDLSAAIVNMSGKMDQADKWTQSVAESVHFNAGLLNALVIRVNNIEAAMGLQTQQANDQVAKVDEVIADAKTQFAARESKIDVLTGDVKKGLELVHAGDQDKDGRLRTELDAMAAKIEKSHSDMEAQIKLLASTKVSDGNGGVTVDLGPMEEAVRGLNKHVASFLDRFVIF